MTTTKAFVLFIAATFGLVTCVDVVARNYACYAKGKNGVHYHTEVFEASFRKKAVVEAFREHLTTRFGEMETIDCSTGSVDYISILNSFYDKRSMQYPENYRKLAWIPDNGMPGGNSGPSVARAVVSGIANSSGGYQSSSNQDGSRPRKPKETSASWAEILSSGAVDIAAASQDAKASQEANANADRDANGNSQFNTYRYNSPPASEQRTTEHQRKQQSAGGPCTDGAIWSVCSAPENNGRSHCHSRCNDGTYECHPASK